MFFSDITFAAPPVLYDSDLSQNNVIGCLVQVGNGIELEAVGLQFEPYWWRPCGVTQNSSGTVVVIKLLRTWALRAMVAFIHDKDNVVVAWN